jgi:hypothetical protein
LRRGESGEGWEGFREGMNEWRKRKRRWRLPLKEGEGGRREEKKKEVLRVCRQEANDR